MINQQTVQGNWNALQGKIRSKWGALTDDDLQIAHGSIDQLIGAIQRKTGEARESIEQFFEQWNADGAAAIAQAGETVRAYARQASDSVHETSEKATASARESYAEVEGMVRRRPGESLAVCFAVGLITGVVVSLMARGR